VVRPEEVDAMSDQTEYLTVEDLAKRLGIARITAWQFLRRADLQRYRLPGHGKTTFVRWDEAERAYKTPRPVRSSRAGDPGKAIPLAV
jgi:predicted DNA-binding transcriptional regulator AlpA